MGKPKVSRYITVGFDTEERAKKFRSLIEGNGLLVKLYETFEDEEGNKKGKVNNIQARSCHEWTPTTWERRRFEFGGVTIEFKDQTTANEFLTVVAKCLSGEYSLTMGDEVEDEVAYAEMALKLATELLMILRTENVVGAKIERD